MRKPTPVWKVVLWVAIPVLAFEWFAYVVCTTIEHVSTSTEVHTDK